MHSKCFHLLVKILILVLPVFGLTQNLNHVTLKGEILDVNGSPITFAQLYIVETTDVYQTDAQGGFVFENLPRLQQITVEILDGSYAQAEFILNALQNRDDLRVQLEKPNQVIQLNSVEARGMNHGEKMRDRGFAVGVVDTKSMESQSVQSVELLNRATGIQIRQSGGLGSDISFNLNGLTGNAVRIFIDGISLQNYGRSFSLSNIPPSMIERIEVYKGVLPANLSEDALGGGVNIVLKKNLRNNLSAAYSYGSFNTHQFDVNGNLYRPESGLILRVSGFYNTTDNNYEVWGDNVYIVDNSTGRKTYVKARRFHDGFTSMGVKADVGITKKSWADELNLGFVLSETEKDIQTGATMQVVYGNRKTDYLTGLGSLDYKKDDLFVKGLDFKTLTTYSKTNRQVTDTIPFIYNWYGEIVRDQLGNPVRWSKGGGEAGPATFEENTEINLANRSNLTYEFLPKQAVGINYYINTFTRDIDDPLLPNETREALDKRRFNKQVTGFNYDGTFWQDKLKATLFYKLYRQSVNLTDVTRTFQPGTGTYLVTTQEHDRKINDNGYGFAFSYAFLPQWSLLLSGERAVRLPGSTELLGNTSENIDPNYTLVPEKSYNLNAGFIAGPFRMAGHEVMFDVNFFARDIRDMILQGVSRNNDDTFNFENIGKVMSKGVDVDVRYNFNQQFFLHAGVSYNDTRFKLQYNQFGVEYFYYNSRLRNTPYFNSNVNAEYHINNFLQDGSTLALNYNFAYVHEFFRDWENLSSVNKATIPAQLIHDAALIYTFPGKQFTLSFNAKNIFNEQAFDNYALQKPGRAFYGKITYNIF